MLVTGANGKIQKRNTDAVRSYMHSLFDPDLSGMSDSAKTMYRSAHQQAQISLAGEKLQQMRIEAKQRRARLYTGYLGRRRAWFGQPVVLPGNVLGKIMSVYRGFAAVSWHDDFSVQGNRVTSFETAAIQPYKHPAAVALGACKRGLKERPSAKKARTAWLNGHAPPRPGSRPRGRPSCPQEARDLQA